VEEAEAQGTQKRALTWEEGAWIPGLHFIGW
jgi:hypothetical protein